MSIFIGYTINGIILAPLALYGYFTNQLLVVSIIIGIAIVLLALPTFRYARVLWLYVDHVLDPRID